MALCDIAIHVLHVRSDLSQVWPSSVENQLSPLPNKKDKRGDPNVQFLLEKPPYLFLIYFHLLALLLRSAAASCIALALAAHRIPGRQLRLPTYILLLVVLACWTAHRCRFAVRGLILEIGVALLCLFVFFLQIRAHPSRRRSTCI